MSNAGPQGALNQYRQVGVESSILEASPHRIIQMLMNGALEKISTAKGHMERNELAEKGRQVSWAVSIVEGLRASLDHNAGGEIAQNLDALYEYMVRRLWESNRDNNVEILAEVSTLLSTLKEGWDAIPESFRNMTANSEAKAANR